MADFKVIETQEQFDERIKERLGRAENKIREEFKGWTSPDDLTKIRAEYDAKIEDMTKKHAADLEKYSGYDEKFSEYESEIKTLKTSALKTRIANEKKLPFDAVEFLQGDDEKSITESAEKLSKLSANNNTFGFTRNTEEPAGSAIDNAYRQLAKSTFEN